MANETKAEIVLYDLACTKNVCFSPVVWKIRQMLNYKRVPYKTVFLEFPDIEPTLKSFGLTSAGKYTVPTIHHIPSNKYLMDSEPISQFIESTYPDPPLLLISELGREIEAKARITVGTAFRHSLMPRETGILSPSAAEFFRRTREAPLGHRLEDMLEGDKEEQAWRKVVDEIRALDELMQTNKADGPFVLGARPSYTDFFIAGALQCARVIHEGTFQRMVEYPGHRGIYEACQPYMEKKD